MEAVDVVDPITGRPVPCDGATMGEIVLRGDCVMLGYLKDAGSDDAGNLQGRVVLHGRRRGDAPGRVPGDQGPVQNVIISGGENISSVEVESVLCSHPAVDEAAVIARPDEFWGRPPAPSSASRSRRSRRRSKNGRRQRR
uniref:AMP-binding enzyme C-terminal domain-containing protein n=1 Tax=Ananas comosus var. bracteatus TaxID=296719 RepID=A0A6V7QCV3_ANACO|nr:unnamed protein product [Ananas comosus var. bracteatus]